MAKFLPLRLGIIGAGRAARFLHVPALLALRDRIEVCGVADVDLDAARAVCLRFPGARAFADAAEILASAEVEAVAILTPPASHAELAVRALRAGKHVFVEKPLAASADEAGEMIRAAREARLCAAAGHNLRFHRLVRRAREALQAGVLGRLIEIQTLWNSPAQGGGVILDLGVHHVDLARFLTSSEFQELSNDTSGAHDDLRARVSGVLENGVRFSGLWTREPPAAHTVRLTGTVASAEFSMYSAISWRHSPVARPRQAWELVADLFHAIGKLRSGGDSAESYRLEWIDFAEAVRTGGAPGCPFEQAAKNVAACRALMARAAEPASEPVRTEESGPALSVVLGIRGSFATVRRTVRHLRSQTIQKHIELVLVWASREKVDVPASELGGFFSWVVEQIPPESPVAAANAAGVRSASAPVVAFSEDHCFPEPGWAEALLQAHAGGYAAVGPEIANANPGSIVSWCDYLIAYGPWMSPAAPGEAPFLPGHNSSYKREVLLGYGGRLEAMLAAETVLHFDLARQGRRLFVEPRARAAHLNFALWRIWLPVQYNCGRVFASSRAAQWPLARRAFYAAASPLIPAVRLLRICRELLRPRRPTRLLPRLAPALALGLICDGAGQMLGYLAGAGRSPQRLADFEYNRVRYIRPEDERALAEADAHAAT